MARCDDMSKKEEPMLCECFDPSCTECQGDCSRKGRIRMYHIDDIEPAGPSDSDCTHVVRSDGTLFCSRCAHWARNADFYGYSSSPWRRWREIGRC
jgi:hypothetical protein